MACWTGQQTRECLRLAVRDQRCLLCYVYSVIFPKPYFASSRYGADCTTIQQSSHQRHERRNYRDMWLVGRSKGSCLHYVGRRLAMLISSSLGTIAHRSRSCCWLG